jgi:transcriptional regulator with XRE-family HTH domain
MPNQTVLLKASCESDIANYRTTQANYKSMLFAPCYHARMADVVTRLGELMRENGDDQTSLARKVGCTPAAINQILTGRTQRSRLLPEIADLYDVALPYLLGRWDTRGRGAESERSVNPDERRLLQLTQRMTPEDRQLVYTFASRLAGVPPVMAEPRKDYRPAETLHDRRQGFKPQEEGKKWGD